MKKNVLALSIAAMIGGFAGAASAQNVELGTGTAAGVSAVTTAERLANVKANKIAPSTATKFAVADGGTGHVLLVPYFTTQNQNMSVIHLVNTDTNNGKALKVRFRGAANSDDLLDFTVFLSPGDVWTGAVQADANGSYFRTDDGSCTIPDIRKKNVAFGKSRLNKSWDAATLTNNTKEGYVEIFNAADIPSDKVYGKDNDANSSLYTAIKHVDGVAPCTSTVLDKTLNYSGELATEALKAAYGFDTPTGQLTGDWYILNVDQTTTFSGTATALKAVNAAGATARGNYILFPQQGETIAADALTADPLLITKPADKAGKILKGPLVTPNNADLPDLSTPYFMGALDTTGVKAAKQAFDLTASLAKGAVSNQYATDSILKAKTDWVFSMPTRRYSVAANYGATKLTDDNYAVFNLGVNVNGTLAGAAQSAAAVAATPAQAAAEMNYFNGSNVSVDAASGNLCVNSSATKFYDREENSKTGGAFTSPVESQTLRFCGETSVLSFTNDASVLGASVARSVTTEAYTNGWANVSLAKPGSANANVIGGLPMVGASFIKLTNAGGLANNFSGTYGITWPHRYGN